jgi:two-component system, cell cycle sensor histidine kinase and response regulator CckA
MSGTGNNAETILIVEDESAVLNMITDILQSKGYNLLRAQNGDEALEVGRQFQGKIDLVLTDIVMPGMSGGELVQQLQRVKPEIRILYMSGYTKYTVVSPGSLQSVDAFIWKPFTPAELLQKVREVLDSPAHTP